MPWCLTIAPALRSRKAKGQDQSSLQTEFETSLGYKTRETVGGRGKQGRRKGEEEGREGKVGGAKEYGGDCPAKTELQRTSVSASGSASGET